MIIPAPYQQGIKFYTHGAHMKFIVEVSATHISSTNLIFVLSHSWLFLYLCSVSVIRSWNPLAVKQQFA